MVKNISVLERLGEAAGKNEEMDIDWPRWDTLAAVIYHLRQGIA